MWQYYFYRAAGTIKQPSPPLPLHSNRSHPRKEQEGGGEGKEEGRARRTFVLWERGDGFHLLKRGPQCNVHFVLVARIGLGRVVTRILDMWRNPGAEMTMH
jgi:hypothetical protein